MPRRKPYPNPMSRVRSFLWQSVQRLEMLEVPRSQQNRRASAIDHVVTAYRQLLKIQRHVQGEHTIQSVEGEKVVAFRKRRRA